MSTENMSPVSKDSADKMSKKRRREEELAQTKASETAPEADSTPAKKQKKSKKDREVKVKHEVKVKQEPEDETTIADISEKKDKKKKKKNEGAQNEEAATQDAKPAKTGETTGHDNAPEDAEKTKKSKKKKSKEDAAVTTADNGIEERKPVVSSTSSAISGKKLQSRPPFVQQTTSFYLALSPIAHQFPLEGLCAEHISPLLLTYYPPMKGVVLSYANPRMSETPENGAQIKKGKHAKTVLGQSVDEYAVTYVWLTVDLLVFKPQKDTVLEGYVNLQNESILGLICYNYFNAGIERSRIPKDWQWVEDEAPEEGDMSRKGRREAAGHYVNAEGNKVEGKIVFKVKDFEATAGAETGSGSINIYGTLLAGDEDAKADEDARQNGLVRGRPARR